MELCRQSMVKSKRVHIFLLFHFLDFLSNVSIFIDLSKSFTNLLSLSSSSCVATYQVTLVFLSKEMGS